MRGQSRLMSGIEAVANVAVGFAIALLTQLLVFPAVGLTATAAQNLKVGAAFTAVSLLRSYLLRRSFDRLSRRAPP